MKYFILFFLLTSSLFATEFMKMNGKISKFKKTTNYIAIETKSSKSIKILKEELSKLEIPTIRDIKRLSSNSFIIKFKSSVDESSFKNYRVLPSYNKFGGWPIITNKRIIVKFKEDITTDEQNEILSSFNMKKIHSFDYSDKAFILSVKEDSFKIANILFDSGKFEYSYPDYYILHESYFVPNDTFYQNQWHLNGAYSNGMGGVSAEAAWDINRGSSDIRIAIIDDGMDIYHEDLDVANSYNFIQNKQNVGNTGDFYEDGNNIENKDAFHGTACAGVAAAKGNNGKGTVGLCMNCRVLAAQIMASSNYGYASADSQAFDWAVRNRADVLNNSWGYAGENLNLNLRNYNSALYDSIHNATVNGRDGKGSVVLFAAGNDSLEFNDSSLPGHPDIITIGATNYQDARSYYSNYGNRLDLMAPSNGASNYAIWTTDIMGSVGYSTDNYTSDFGGTSSATPLTSGLVGLMLSQNKNLTSARVKEILILTADKVAVADELPNYPEYSCRNRSGASYDSNGHSNCMGYGKINAYKALRYVRDYDKCKSITCSGLGECVVENNIATCECQNGYHAEGTNCVKDVDPCANVTCSGHGDCSVSNGKAICSCDTGYDRVGDKICEKNYCHGIDCSGHGDCTAMNNTPVCQCYMGYDQIGTTCVKGDACSSISCSDKGYCDIFGGGGQCVCIKGYHANGPYCLPNNDSNPCKGVVCNNEGTCEMVDGVATCKCDSGYKASALNCLPDDTPADSGICSYSSKSSNPIFLIFFLAIIIIIRKKTIFNK